MVERILNSDRHVASAIAEPAAGMDAGTPTEPSWQELPGGSAGPTFGGSRPSTRTRPRRLPTISSAGCDSRSRRAPPETGS